jgi:hypothetical protein
VDVVDHSAGALILSGSRKLDRDSNSRQFRIGVNKSLALALVRMASARLAGRTAILHPKVGSSFSWPKARPSSNRPPTIAPSNGLTDQLPHQNLITQGPWRRQVCKANGRGVRPAEDDSLRHRRWQGVRRSRRTSHGCRHQASSGMKPSCRSWEDIDDRPALGDPFSGKPKDDDLLIGHGLARRRATHVLASAGAGHRVATGDLVSLSDQILGRNVQVGEGPVQPCEHVLDCLSTDCVEMSSRIGPSSPSGGF